MVMAIGVYMLQYLILFPSLVAINALVECTVALAATRLAGFNFNA